jgi:hypothetical protein
MRDKNIIDAAPLDAELMHLNLSAFATIDKIQVLIGI